MLLKFGWRFIREVLMLAVALCGVACLLGQACSASAADNVPLSITGAENPEANGVVAASGGEDLEESDVPAPSKPAETAAHSVHATTAGSGDIVYTVRPGDSLGGIADEFHIPLADLIKRNRLNPDSTLQAGVTLRIPNPFTAQVRELKQSVQLLQGQNQQLRSQLQDATEKDQASARQAAELKAERGFLEHEVQVLPWWRRITAIAIGVAVLLLGITGLAMFEWFRMRAWFSALARANERLRGLDQHYRRLVARAELRFQQLYGRRRAPAENSGKSPEEFEIERLNRELKQIIETQLNDLGVPTYSTARRSRLREWLVGGSSPAVIRSGRR